MALNIELLKRLKTRFMRMRHPEHFDMSVWAHRNECGTAMCIAGHALDLQGYKTRPKDYQGISGNLEFLSPKGNRLRKTIAEVAAREMGIDSITARWLFANNGSITTPKDAAARIQQLIDTAPTKTAKGKGR